MLKTSALIQKLIEIDKTVPFDADVVTGEDWWPSPVSRVYHNPPNTYIEFQYEGSQGEDPDELSVYKELEIRTHQMILVRDFIKSNLEIKPEEIIDELNTQITRQRAMAEAIINKS